WAAALGAGLLLRRRVPDAVLGVVDREGVAARVREAQLDVLDALHLDAVVRVALDVLLAGGRDAEPGALEADVRVGGRAVLLEGRRAVRQLTGLDHARHRALHQLAVVGDRVVLVLVDDRVAARLEVVAADDDELALDGGGADARRR